MTEPTRQPAPAQPEPSFEDIPVVTETTTPAQTDQPERLTVADIDRLGGDTTAEPTTPDAGATETTAPNDGVRLAKQRRWYNEETCKWVEGDPPKGFQGQTE